MLVLVQAILLWDMGDTLVVTISDGNSSRWRWRHLAFGIAYLLGTLHHNVLADERFMFEIWPSESQAIQLSSQDLI
ncbi:hypothetical protein LCGC14_1611970, partial [marine sediment metagenome]